VEISQCAIPLAAPIAFAFLACATSATIPEEDSGTDPMMDAGGGCTAMCGNTCVDTKTDNNNCGKCGRSARAARPA
jgi:hypothetical protein